MKLADSDSRLGKKLEKWLPHDKKESSPNNNQSSQQDKNKKRRHDFDSIHEPETKLEKRIKQWFTDEEKQDRPLIIKENGAPVKILVITYKRAIWFEAGLFCRLKDVSD
ncbi:MAG: hypothetical protein D3925_15955, partial [Candidatus Electrothrix sp. AR5]|nr:hypothetical protein [Candidatus Electrothrix sp. AR5]